MFPAYMILIKQLTTSSGSKSVKILVVERAILDTGLRVGFTNLGSSFSYSLSGLLTKVYSRTYTWHLRGAALFPILIGTSPGFGI